MTEQETSGAIEDLFSAVYERNLWGGQAGAFCSGPGSAEALTEPYCVWLAAFIATRCGGAATVVDLGCGDFRVGRRLMALAPGIDYVGVDVVPELIADNTRRYAGPRVSFRQADISADALPPGDICLIRQVLQHLSNARIARIVARLATYRYVFVTEHYPARLLVPNVDKPTDNRTRRRQASAVDLAAPPFHVPGVALVLTVPYQDEATPAAVGETLRTFMIEHPAPRLTAH